MTREAALRVGFVGLGRVVERFHLRALARSRTWRLAAGCDISAERRRAMRPFLGDVPIYPSFEDMLSADPMDAVLIATPPAAHAQLAALALESEMAVLLEKPMATDLAESDNLVKVAQATGRLIWVGFNRRFLEAYVKCKDLIHGGVALEDEPAEFSFEFPAERWESVTGYLGHDRQGGEALEDAGSHQVDLASWLFGEPVVEVRGIQSESRPVGDRSFRFELRLRGGRVVACRADHGHRYREFVSVPTQSGTLQVESWQLLRAGHKPSAMGQVRRAAVPWVTRSLRRLVGIPDGMVSSFAAQWESFGAALSGKGPADRGATASDGARNVRILEAIRASLASGGGWLAVPAGREEP